MISIYLSSDLVAFLPFWNLFHQIWLFKIIHPDYSINNSEIFLIRHGLFDNFKIIYNNLFCWFVQYRFNVNWRNQCDKETILDKFFSDWVARLSCLEYFSSDTDACLSIFKYFLSILVARPLWNIFHKIWLLIRQFYTFFWRTWRIVNNLSDFVGGVTIIKFSIYSIHNSKIFFCQVWWLDC